MRIVLVGYGGGHVAMLAPLAAKAREAGHRVMFLALTTAQDYLRQQGENFLTAQDMWEFAAPHARDYGEELAASLIAHHTIPHAESVAYLGISFADLAAQHGEANAHALYKAHGRQAFLPVATLTRAFTQWRPDLVVATNSPRMERAAIEAAGALGIPSVCLVDLFASHEIEWIGQPGFGTKICVLNETVRQMVIEHGRRSDEVVVTGNPAFDRLFAPELLRAGKALREQRGWNDGRITMLYGSQEEFPLHTFKPGAMGDVLLPEKIETTLRRFVVADARFRLVIRYHPNQKQVFEPGPNVEFSPVHENVAMLLHAVDAVVTMTSTIGVEAYIAGKPVITVDCSLFTKDAPYSSMGISQGVAKPDGLPAVLENLASNSAAAPPRDASLYRIRDATQEIWRILEATANKA